MEGFSLSSRVPFYQFLSTHWICKAAYKITTQSLNIYL